MICSNNGVVEHLLTPTPLRRLDDVRFCEVLVKDESAQPLTRTHKDRRSVAIVADAVRAGINAVGIITAGNAGLSLAKAAKGQLHVCAILSDTVHQDIAAALAIAGATVERRNLTEHLSPTMVVEVVRRHFRGRIQDATDGYEWAYAAIVDELYAQQPEAIVCPVGTGQLFMGLSEGVRRNGMSTKIIGVQPAETDRSIADKLRVRWRPYQHRIDLVCGLHHHRVIEVPEAEVHQAVLSVPDGIEAEPSAAIVFAALPELQRLGVSKAILINTGKGVRGSE